MSATIKRGTIFTLPAWKARRKGERTRYATVTRVIGGIVYYTLDTDRATAPRHTRSLALLQQYAEVTP
jgi:hypothetical protein